MKTFRHRIEGVTLLEVILVLTIGGAIFLIGLQQYQTFRRYANQTQLMGNVDTLFSAAAMFYKANCRVAGVLGPTGSSLPAATYRLNITTQLVTPGYLAATNVRSPLLETTGGWDGYLVQFNRSTGSRTIRACGNGACTFMTDKHIGTIVNYTIQVAIKLADKTMAQQYKSLLNATCVSSANASGGVASCGSDFSSQCISLRNTPTVPYSVWWDSQNMADLMGCPAAIMDMTLYDNFFDNYVVFERAPSFATNEDPPDLGATNHVVDQFTQMYYTYPMTNLTTRDHTTEFQFFVCGS